MKVVLLVLTALLKYEVPLVNTEIQIDGVLEPVWDSALVFSEFKVLEPTYGSSPSYNTFVCLLQTSDAIFVAFKCEQKVIRKNVGLRDRAEGDLVGIFLETFNGGNKAYLFAVNAAGVQLDGIVENIGRARDLSWDGVWYSAVKDYEGYYVVEFKIPFRTLQFDQKESQFGFEATRYISETSERLFLGTYQRERGMVVRDFPVKLGLKIGTKSVGFELLPVVLIEKADEYLSTTNVLKGFSIKGGFDAKYSPNSVSTMSFTLFPDFSQVEADPFRLNLGRYEERLEERRPFFVEGSEVFKFRSSPYYLGFGPSIDPFYSRRIGKALSASVSVPIIYGFKGIWKSRDLEGGILSAHTGDAMVIDYYGDTLREKSAFYNAISLKKSFGGSTDIGFIYSGKMEKDLPFKNHAFGLNVHYFFDNTEVAGAFSRSYYTDYSGNAYSFDVVQVNPKYHFRLSFINTDSTYDVSEIGYTPWVGLKRLSVVLGPNLEVNYGGLRYFDFTLGYINSSEYWNGWMPQHNFILHSSLNFNDGSGVEFFAFGGKAYVEDYYNNYGVNLEWWSSNKRAASYSFGLNFERDYNYLREYVGKSFFHRFRIEYNGYSKVNLSLVARGWLEIDPEDNLEEYTLSVSPRLQYAISRNLLLNLYGELAYSFVEEAVVRKSANLLLAYNFKPKSWVYFVLSRGYDFYSEPANFMNFIAKVRYLFYF